MVNLVPIILRAYPNLKTALRIAHMKYEPEQFVKISMRTAAYVSIGLTAFVFFLLARQTDVGNVIYFMLVTLILSYPATLIFILSTPKGIIRKRQRDIEREVLYAGRYVLIKLESGQPIVNTLVDASKSYGVASKYFKEIVDEIDAGVPVEIALDHARAYNSSDKFKKIIWQIIATLKTGTDVTEALKGTIKNIAADQIIEIKAYAKKLNSLMLFYMVTACVAPSLGLTMFLILATFLNLEVGNWVLFMVLFFLVVLQMFFLIMIRGTRPMVDL